MTDLDISNDASNDEKKDSNSPVYQIPQRNDFESLEYSSTADSYTAFAESSVTGHPAKFHQHSHADATEVVHEMHLALLYLLSHPDEFHKALMESPIGTGSRVATTLAQWNAEYDTESIVDDGQEGSVLTSKHENSLDSYSNDKQAALAGSTPLPFVVFADDAEVVLPQAHTASQLFGLERIDGIELEAAAGIPAISQLFLRWLALMPGGDHLNIIDPPGLTVMRIAGGRYRVTAAHRVVWTWMNNFAALNDDTEEEVDKLQIGDLVTMTIIDVFETDNQGKLLSYCPTFDNRAVHKTMQTTETLIKSRGKLLKALHDAQNSKLAKLVMEKATIMGNMVKQRVVDATKSSYESTTGRKRSDSSGPAFSDAAVTLHPEQFTVQSV
ncbi:hypothetical protein MPSEU_000884800 [Mayamaea pseudoterrestris]|nr:hypothetical protein MPSEU_000884800 [Mayamaea pseudoterrestris]